MTARNGESHARPAANGMVYLTCTIPEEMLARLDKAKDERLVGRNLIVRRGIEMILDKLDAMEDLP